MIQLAEDVFDVKDDPDQLDVNEGVMDRLRMIHPATASEFSDPNGPITWVLIIPTTTELMNRFLAQQISEKELFELTPIGTRYQEIYLCSAMVLKEYRRKGIAKRLTLEAIKSIQKDHPIKSLFVWTFSNEGEMAAKEVSKITGLPLHKRGSQSQTPY